MKPDELISSLEGSHTFPLVKCPCCKHPLNQAGGLGPNDPGPQPGDISVCTFCEAPLEVQPDLSLRLLTGAGIAALSDEELTGFLDALEGARTLRKALKEIKHHAEMLRRLQTQGDWEMSNDYLTKCPCGRTTSIAFAQAHHGLCKVCFVPVVTISTTARIFTGNGNTTADTRRTTKPLLNRVSLWLEALGRRL